MATTAFRTSHRCVTGVLQCSHSLALIMSADLPMEQDMPSQSLLLPAEFIWVLQSAEQLIHVDKVMAIIVLVGGVVNGVVPSPHDWRNPAQAGEASSESATRNAVLLSQTLMKLAAACSLHGVIHIYYSQEATGLTWHGGSHEYWWSTRQS